MSQGAAVPTSRREADARRIVALATSIALHLGILLALFGESPSPLPANERPMQVRLIDDPRGRAAGAPANVPFPRMPSATHARVDRPRSGPARIAKARVAPHPQPSPAAVQVVEPAPLPPPAALADTTPRATVSDTATLADRAGATPGFNGSGANGSDASGSMRRIVFTRRVEPALPPSYRRKPVDAVVILAVRIDAYGAPRDLRTVRSSGSSELDFAAREAARKSRYAPHLRNGAPIAFWALIPYEFGKPTIDIEAALAAAGYEHT